MFKRSGSRGSSSEDSAPVDIDGFASFELIGSGGFSRVYRARQDGFDRDVALKVLNIGIETRAQQQAFERECRAMGVLSQHPNIVTVFSAAFTRDQRPCIVMEFYTGGTLGERVNDHGPLSIEAGLSIGVQIAGALHTAHDLGVIHRDIKPNNLFVSEYGQPALGDFGISSFADDRTVTGGGGGLTVHYAPPELIEGDNATAASDVYSLGATLFSLMVGRRPFPRGPSQSVGELARRILIEPPPRLDADGTPPELAALLQEAMAKSPEDRPANAAEFGERLRSIQHGLGLAPTPMSLASEPGRRVEPAASAVAAPMSQAAGATPMALDSEGLATATIARPRAVPLTEDGDGHDGDRSGSRFDRRTRGFVLAAVAAVVLVVVAVAVAATGDSDRRPETETTATTSSSATTEGDNFFSAPKTPSAVSVTPTGNALEVEVRWVGKGDDVSYEIERIDAGHADEAPLAAESSPAILVLEDATERPCVVIRAVGGGGRLSADTDPVCLPPSS